MRLRRHRVDGDREQRQIGCSVASRTPWRSYQPGRARRGRPSWCRRRRRRARDRAAAPPARARAGTPRAAPRRRSASAARGRPRTAAPRSPGGSAVSTKRGGRGCASSSSSTITLAPGCSAASSRRRARRRPRALDARQAHERDGVARARDDLVDVRAEDRAGRHHEAVGDVGRGGRAAVDRAVDQHLLGAEREHRVAHRAHLCGRARPGHLDRAPARPGARSARARAACAHPCARAARGGRPLARSRLVGGRHEAPRRERHARLLDAEVDHVVLLAVAPDRGHADRAPARSSSRSSVVSATVLPVFLASPTSASRRAEAVSSLSSKAQPAAATRAASSRTMNVARWWG